MRKKGFTLIELIVVIAMLMLLTGAVTSALSSARKRAKVSKATVVCQEMTNAILAYENYTKDHSLEKHATSGSWQPANKGSIQFILGGEKAENGEDIPVLFNAEIKGTQMLDPWGNPYYYRIQKARSQKVDDDLANQQVDTCVFFPNFNRRLETDR